MYLLSSSRPPRAPRRAPRAPGVRQPGGVAPARVDTRPAMCLVFELFLLGGRRKGPDRCVAWAVLPLTDARRRVVKGRFRLPMLRGAHHAAHVDKYGALERRYGSKKDVVEVVVLQHRLSGLVGVLNVLMCKGLIHVRILRREVLSTCIHGQRNDARPGRHVIQVLSLIHI